MVAYFSLSCTNVIKHGPDVSQIRNRSVAIDSCFLLLFCFQELIAEISEIQQKKDDLEAELKKVPAIFFMMELLLFIIIFFWILISAFADFGISFSAFLQIDKIVYRLTDLQLFSIFILPELNMLFF
jgi:cellulose synthase/poly-beta-1,6-N-acetylglucosamine synthase-like glycosyltransferase